jgi:predicted ATPase
MIPHEIHTLTVNERIMSNLFNSDKVILRTLGNFRLETEVPVTGSKPLLIFAYLLIETGKHSRKHLEKRFFGKKRNNANSLAAALVKLKKSGLIGFDYEAAWALEPYQSDLHYFYSLLKENHLRRAAYEVYQGKFLEGIQVKGLTPDIEDWIFEKREAVEGAVFNAKILLAKQELEKIDLSRAVQQAEDAWYRHSEALNSGTIDTTILKELYTMLSAGQSLLQDEVVQKINEDFPDLEIDFEALKPQVDNLIVKTSRTTITTDVPHSVTDFIGRGQDLLRVTELAKHNRLITLLGIGGIGKTRIAMQLALEVKEQTFYQDGVYYYSLETVTPEQLIFVLSQGLGLPPSYDTRVSIRNHLQNKHVLLVLDNFEHLVHCHDTLTFLLQISPRLHLLITSRERTNLEGEQLYDVQGLDYPDNQTLSPEDALTYGAIQLFNNRRRKIESSFIITEDALSPVLTICQTVWGMPLAIELAAGMRHRTLSDIATGITQLDFLKSRIHGKPQRHKTLRHVFEYSWQFLNETERRVFRQMSVFEDGFTLEAAQHLIPDFSQVEIDLLDKSLLAQSPEGRYKIHPLLHEYAREKLSENPTEHKTLHQHHATYFLDQLMYMIDAPTPELKNTTPKRLSSELANLGKAWRWAADHQWERVLPTTQALQWFFDEIARYQEGIVLLDYALQHFDPEKHKIIVGNLIAYKGWLTMRLSQYDEAVNMAERALSMTKGSEHHPSQRTALNTLGSSYIMMGYFEKAEESFREALRIVPEGSIGAGYVMGNLGLSQKSLGNYENAQTYLITSQAIFESTNQQNAIVWIKYLLGSLYIDIDETDKAEYIFLEAIAISENLGLTRWLNLLRIILAYTYLCKNEISNAYQLITKSLLQAQLRSEQFLESESLTTLGLIYIKQRNYTEALSVLKRSLKASYEEHDIPLLLCTLITLFDIYLQTQNAPKQKKISASLLAHENINRMTHVDKMRLRKLCAQHNLLPEREVEQPYLSLRALIEFLISDTQQSDEGL